PVAAPAAHQRRSHLDQRRSEHVGDDERPSTPDIHPLAPGPLTTCFRATGGFEAVDLALQAAMIHTGRRALPSLEGSYHGNSLAVLSIARPTAASARTCCCTAARSPRRSTRRRCAGSRRS